jgi:UDP-N-acetylglucosamine--N-acetylmuramyl-(pentapeptide) pyrophosphoryl-undecaprenol N-acetylglucosamine transferase
MNAPVLWYVHHHGAGHWRRALAVTRELDQDVVLVSSSAPPAALPPRNTFVALPMDAPGDGDVTAHGRLHWAPTHHAGLLERHARILAVAQRHRPAVAVVDVSVEVTVLLRSCGIPVIGVRLPGQRVDAAHDLGFGLADQVVMPVPQSWEMHRSLARTVAVGLVSALVPSRPAAGEAPGDDVVVVVGRGGSRIDLAACRRLAADVPDRTVRVLGLDPAPGVPPNLLALGHVPDPSAVLASAGVVVANCGLGTVADVVRAARPLVVLPEERPFGEQAATAAALAGDAVVLAGPPGAGGWATAVHRAETLGPPRLAVDGAERFAAVVNRLAAGRAPAVVP